MNFQSFHFLVFFLVNLVVVRLGLGRGSRASKTFLLVSSYYFYMCWDWRFGFLILGITVINFVAGRGIDRAADERSRRRWLALALSASLGILAYFKYLDFFIGSANAALRSLGASFAVPFVGVMLPVGVSFYTFQSISYSLDVYRRRLRPVEGFRDFALFVVFFPQLVAGPIVRATDFLPQLAPGRRVEPVDAMESGLALIVRGFVKKIAIADLLARHYVDPAFGSPAAFSPVFLVLALYAYSFQVYMDFSGYTDIARGTARVLGYELQINFNRPYQATSISDFWQRWHISMSSFFRDYLYFGLGGSQRGNVYVNLMVTFVAIGVWHGAGWNFVVYGACHGLFVCVERFRRVRRKRLGQREPVYTGNRWAWRVFWIFSLVSFARILFRAGSLEGAVRYAGALLDFSNTSVPVNAIGGLVLLAAVALHYTPERWATGWKEFFCRLPAPAQAVVLVGTTWLLVALGSGQAPFIYFQF